MPPGPGTKLGPYEVLAPLGAGGMGEVYRARDPRLGREVAIKVLPAEVAGDPERLARFRREAHVLASLNHPNIAAIHGLEEADGKRFLVLELVEGEDLSERLKRGPIPVDEATAVARQIAEALEEAHGKGIVHRDLKPANVKVTGDGKVKVLDFGLAKAWAGDGTSGSSPDLSHSPTMTRLGTQAGLILGTAAYMSPEQARGKSVDKRADIWAFGVVLFEMLTGRRLFTGDTVSDVLAAVLKEEPDWSRLPQGTPARIVEVLRHCLRRDPRQRLHDIGDARIEIEESALDPDPARMGLAGAAGRRSLTRTLLSYSAVLALGLALGAAALRTRTPVAPAPDNVRFVAQPFDVLSGGSVALSRDGRRLVYWNAAQPGLFVRELDQAETHRVEGTAGGFHPFLSPDGQWVGFYADLKMKKVALAGGDPIAICDTPVATPGAAWGRDGTILFTPDWQSGLHRVAAAGGQPVAITSPEKHTAHIWPDILPDGKGVVFTIFGGAGLSNAKVALLDLETERHEVLLDGAAGCYFASGHLVFHRAGVYFAVPFDAARRRVTGPERRVLREVRPLNPVGAPGSNYSFSDTGRLAFVPQVAASRSRMAWIYRDGRTEELPFEGDHSADHRLSPDGRRVAVGRMDGGDLQVWIYDLARGTQEKVTREGLNLEPSWHPDGSRIAFTAMIRGNFDVREAPADGSGRAKDLVATDRDESAWVWLPDGRSARFDVYSAETALDIWSADPSHPETRRALPGSTPLHETSTEFSPDGKWVSYSDDARNANLYVARSTDLTARTLVTQASSSPRWSLAAPELLFIQAGRLMSVRYEARADSFRFLPARPLLDLPRGVQFFDVAPDGSRFLIRKPGSERRDPRGAGRLRRAAAAGNAGEPLIGSVLHGVNLGLAPSSAPRDPRPFGAGYMREVYRFSGRRFVRTGRALADSERPHTAKE